MTQETSNRYTFDELVATLVETYGLESYASSAVASVIFDDEEILAGEHLDTVIIDNDVLAAIVKKNGKLSRDSVIYLQALVVPQNAAMGMTELCSILKIRPETINRERGCDAWNAYLNDLSISNKKEQQTRLFNVMVNELIHTISGGGDVIRVIEALAANPAFAEVIALGGSRVAALGSNDDDDEDYLEGECSEENNFEDGNQKISVTDGEAPDD